MCEIAITFGANFFFLVTMMSSAKNRWRGLPLQVRRDDLVQFLCVHNRCVAERLGEMPLSDNRPLPHRHTLKNSAFSAFSTICHIQTSLAYFEYKYSYSNFARMKNN